MPLDEPEIGICEESPISFRLSGPSGRLSRFDQSEEEMTSSGGSAMHSPRWKARRRLTHKDKGKKKASDSGTGRNGSDRRESDSKENGEGTSRAKSRSAKKASTSANERLRRSTRQKNPIVWFGYNEYMVHHYAYMTREGKCVSRRATQKRLKTHIGVPRWRKRCIH